MQQQIKSYEPRIVKRMYAGVPLTVSLRDPMAEGWYAAGYHAQPELDFLADQGRLKSGATVFDLGAHQGVIALVCAARVGAGKVIAVEAEPHNAKVAEENARLNGGLPVTVEHAAVAATEPGTVWFTEALNGAVLGGGRAGKVPVQAVTIDGLAERHGHPDVVIIDVEGCEGRALEGAHRVLASRRTDFLIEIHDVQTLGGHGWHSRQLARHLQDAGGEVWVAPAYDGPVQDTFAPLATAAVDWDRRLYCVALFR